MNAQLAPATPEYRICDGGRDVADARAAAVRAWRGSLGDDEALLGDRYDALVLRSPHGRPVVRFVEHARDGIVGFLALAPRPMCAGGRRLRAGVLSHLAIHPDHRSLGPALMLIESVLQAAGDGFDLVYGIPNAHQGASAALRRAGLRPLAGMERSVRIVRHGHYLRRKLPRLLSAPAGLVLDVADAAARRWRTLRGPRLRARWADRFEPGMDAAWAAAGPHPALTAVRDADMLRWRFDRGVGMPIRYLLVQDAAGAVRAWFACGFEPQWPHVLDVHDFWSADARDGVPPAAIRMLLAEARRRGHASVSLRAAIGDGAAAPWRASGFRPRGEQQVVVKWIDAALAAAPPPPHLTYIDQDG